MRRCAKQIAFMACALLIICVCARVLMKDSFVLHVRLSPGTELPAPERTVVTPDSAGSVRLGTPVIHDGTADIPVYPDRRGRVYLETYDDDGRLLYTWFLNVTPAGTVRNLANGDFTGDSLILAACALFFLLVSAVMLYTFVTARPPQLYSYAAIYYAGFSLFSLLTGLMLAVSLVRHLSDPYNYSMNSAFLTIKNAPMEFLMLSFPFIAVFSAAMAVSNIELLRRERKRFQNALGILIAVFLLAGGAGGIYLGTRPFAGSEWEYRLTCTFESVYATVFVYFECMLTGAIFCALKAVRHRPAGDADYIVILGCRFRKDGTLPPLLRGRVDRAIDLWRRQTSSGGKSPVIIPSGGQGPDEVMPEAAAMHAYLTQQGVPESAIVEENRSVNTYQNMTFSKEIIAQRGGSGLTVFVTTNYHVFRSGVWASLAGLTAEGVGSRTKWWYWPNAFMRECVGLLENRWKTEILLLLTLAVFFGAISMTLF